MLVLELAWILCHLLCYLAAVGPGQAPPIAEPQFSSLPEGTEAPSPAIGVEVPAPSKHFVCGGGRIWIRKSSASLLELEPSEESGELRSH